MIVDSKNALDLQRSTKAEEWIKIEVTALGKAKKKKNEEANGLLGHRSTIPRHQCPVQRHSCPITRHQYVSQFSEKQKAVSALLCRRYRCLRWGHWCLISEASCLWDFSEADVHFFAFHCSEHQYPCTKVSGFWGEATVPHLETLMLLLWIWTGFSASNLSYLFMIALDPANVACSKDFNSIKSLRSENLALYVWL